MKTIRIRGNISTSTKGVIQPEVTVEITQEFDFENTKFEMMEMEKEESESVARVYKQLAKEFPTIPE